MGGSSANRLTLATSQGVDGDVLGGTGGEEAHTQTTNELVSHAHTIAARGRSSYSSGSISVFTGAIEDGPALTIPSTGGGAPFNVIQPTIILNYIIYAGV
jgi:microcystin-dependent protein